MSTGKLKASTNRVRTSVSLQSNSIWTNTIGVEKEGGGNSVVEASLNAPQFGGGRAARRAAAAEVVAQTGGFDSAVADYESLMAMARSQGAIGSGPRGACKTCGQLGHLTKQCRNHLSTYFAGQPAVKPSLPVLPEGGDESEGDLSDLSSSSDSESESSSDSEEERRRRKKEKERKRKRKEKKSKEKKSSKDKKHKKSKKHKKEKTKD